MSELITLAELAKFEHISEDAARKRASRGWYDKVKMNGKTLYRRPEIETEPEPPKPANTIQGAIAAVLKDYTAPDPEDERPEDAAEPFPGAWEIADTFDTPWEDMAYYGELFKNDPEAVRLYCFISRLVQDATILHLRVASRPGSKTYGTNTLKGFLEQALSGVEIQAESITERLITAWIEDGKPTLTADYLTEKIKAGITDPAAVEESYFHD